MQKLHVGNTTLDISSLACELHHLEYYRSLLQLGAWWGVWLVFREHVVWKVCNFKSAFSTERCCHSDSSRGDTQGSSRLSLFTLILGNTFRLKCWAESLMLHKLLMLHKSLSALTLGTSGCICKLPVCMRWLHSNVNLGGTHWPEIRRRALPQLLWGLKEVLNLPGYEMIAKVSTSANGLWFY